MTGVRVTRRRSLLGLGGLFAAALGAGAAKATEDGPAGVDSGQIKCVLTPEMTEGPYYLSGEKLRRDITERKPGARLDLALTVVDASTCRPIKGAAVDIWHCDAGGVYSGFGAGSSNRTSSAAGRGPTRTASPISRRSTRVGIQAAPCTST